MKYKDWLDEVFRQINKPPYDKVCTQSITDFPTVDFKHLHRANFNPERAAELAKSVRWFSLPVDEIKYKVVYRK